MPNFHHRILVVDDEPTIVALLHENLKSEGYEVQSAKDGFDALAQMQEVLPDLLITDLKMPNMSGFELLSVIRRRHPQISTIAISGEFEQPAAEQLGVLADAFFSKPCGPKDLFAKIKELLSAAPLRSSPKKDVTPVWVPRNGDYYVITCTNCLRSFSTPAKAEAHVSRELRTLECVFCGAFVEVIIEELPHGLGLPKAIGKKKAS